MAVPSSGDETEEENTLKLRATAVCLLLFLMLITVTFEWVKERLEHGIIHLYQVIFRAFLSELSLLGFVSLTIFFLSYKINDDRSVMDLFAEATDLGALALRSATKCAINMHAVFMRVAHLQVQMHDMHMLLFSIAVGFVLAILLVLFGVKRHTAQYVHLSELSASWREKHSIQHHADRSPSPIRGAPKTRRMLAEGDVFGGGGQLKQRRGAGTSRVSRSGSMRSQALISRAMSHAQGALGSEMEYPSSLWAALSSTVTDDKLLRYQQRFIKDSYLQASPVRIPDDFNFGKYLQEVSANLIAEIIVIQPVDWAAIFLCGVIPWMVWEFVFADDYSLEDEERRVNGLLLTHGVVNIFFIVLVLYVRYTVYRIREELLPVPAPANLSAQLLTKHPSSTRFHVDAHADQIASPNALHHAFQSSLAPAGLDHLPADFAAADPAAELPGFSAVVTADAPRGAALTPRVMETLPPHVAVGAPLHAHAPFALVQPEAATSIAAGGGAGTPGHAAGALRELLQGEGWRGRKQTPPAVRKSSLRREELWLEQELMRLPAPLGKGRAKKEGGGRWSTGNAAPRESEAFWQRHLNSRQERAAAGGREHSGQHGRRSEPNDAELAGAMLTVNEFRSSLARRTASRSPQQPATAVDAVLAAHGEGGGARAQAGHGADVLLGMQAVERMASAGHAEGAERPREGRARGAHAHFAVSGSHFGSEASAVDLELADGDGQVDSWESPPRDRDGGRPLLVTDADHHARNSSSTSRRRVRESCQFAGAQFGGPEVSVQVEQATEKSARMHPPKAGVTDSFLKGLRTEQMAEFVPRYLLREQAKVRETEQRNGVGTAGSSLRGMDARVNPYDRLWPLGKMGPRVLKHMIKLILTFSVIMLALCTLKRGLRGLLVEQHWTLLLIYIFIPLWFIWVVVGLMRDFCLVTCIETRKNHDKIVEVIVAQRNVKAKRAFAALATLCFQLEVLTATDNAPEPPDPRAFKAGRRGKAFSASTKTSIRKQVEAMYQKLAKQNQEFDRELRRIFDAFDERKSGAMSQEQLGGLMNRISGREFSSDEVSRLYEMMDFDGNGMVEYAEMAFVLLHQRAMSEHIDTADVVEKMWRIFPTESNGEITVDGIRETFDRIQLKWDAGAMLRLWDEMDVDRNGSISKQEFIDFINSLELHRNAFGLLAGT